MRIWTMAIALAAAAATAAPALAQQQQQRYPQPQQQYQQQDDQRQYQRPDGYQPQRRQQMMRDDMQQRRQQMQQRMRDPQHHQQMMQQMQQQQQQQEDFQADTEHSGRLVTMQLVRVQGEERVIGELETMQGQTVLLDLGSPDELRRQQVSLFPGAEFDARGRRGQLQGEPLVIVERIRTDQGVVTLNRDAQQQQQWSDQQRTAQPRLREMQDARELEQPADPELYLSVTGQVEDVFEADIQGQRTRIADLRTAGGQQIYVDLGRPEQTQQLQLRQGNWVQIVGQPTRLNQEPALEAIHLMDVLTIDRMRDQRQQRQQQFGIERQQDQPSQQQQQQRYDQPQQRSYQPNQQQREQYQQREENW